MRQFVRSVDSMNKYIGHSSQISSVEEHILVGGKGNGMRLLEVRTGGGLDFTVSLDRSADISRLSFKGVNIGYFAPCGYVAPAFYDNKGAGFLKSFTAGFFTTCGLTAVGSPCTDEGEELPLHGNISNTPAEQVCYEKKDGKIIIKATVRDASLFGNQLLLTRTYEAKEGGNSIVITDVCENIGNSESPFMTLYHFNIGYPMLSETSVVEIPAERVVPRDAHAAEEMVNFLKMEKPQPGFVERCYYHTVKSENGISKVGISNPDAGVKMTMEYDSNALPEFTEWKMMGEYEYVLGLEPGNCTADGRDVMRREGKLKFLKPGERATHRIKITFEEM